MVQVAVRVAAGADARGQWALLDLQGAVESNVDDLRNVELGEITFAENGTAVMVVGRQRLEGKRTPLKVPLAVLERQSDEHGTSYSVVHLLKEKVVFRLRPQPVISEDLKGKSTRTRIPEVLDVC